jgi:ATP synthase F1 complex assembly factor 2
MRADGYSVSLDKRPLKTPEKAPLLIPRSKPLLAHAIALEWTNLCTSADALKSYRIPLTQMSSRAIDLAVAEAHGDFTTREDIVRNLIRYLDTDTVLCWAPSTPENLREPGRPTLRELQIESSEPILAYLSTLVWPGLEVRVVDGDKGLLGSGQPVETKETLVNWMKGLDVWRLVGFERVVHATKSFVVGARLVAEWGGDRDGKWGVKEAAEAASIEVNYQTRQWGEVEDTHDVESEDLLRQIGGGWLLLCGEV